MAYVDLNPIRAGMAETPETSDYTSIQERIRLLKNLPSILTRLNLDASEWLENCQKFESLYCRVVGRIKRVQRFINRAAQK